LTLKYQGFGFQVYFSLEITGVYFIIKGILILWFLLEEL